MSQIEVVMLECLCCAKNLPVAASKRCPVCGHVFQGLGWGGMDAHWKAHHNNLMPYKAFMDSLCDAHRATGQGEHTEHSAPSKAIDAPDEERLEAMARRSSHVENVLTHSLIAKIAQELWRRDPWLDLQVFKADVDDAGFDLVLGCNGIMRFIQIKQTHLQGNAVKYSMRLNFARLKSACAVVLVYNAADLEIDHCLFFGGAPGEPMPDIEGNPTSLLPGRRTADGKRKSRENYRDVPRREFQRLLHTSELVDRLFQLPSLPAQGQAYPKPE